MAATFYFTSFFASKQRSVCSSHLTTSIIYIRLYSPPTRFQLLRWETFSGAQYLLAQRGLLELSLTMSLFLKMSTWRLRGKNYLLVMIMLLKFDHVLVPQEVDMAVNKSVAVNKSLVQWPWWCPCQFHLEMSQSIQATPFLKNLCKVVWTNHIRTSRFLVPWSLPWWGIPSGLLLFVHLGHIK